MSRIKKITALEILDSRGNPTVSTRVELDSGIKATASVPSGASTGKHEAYELRDKGERFMGKGVSRAVKNVENEINRSLKGKSVYDQAELDEILITLDGTKQKKHLGANAILSVSLACARAAALDKSMPLFHYLTKLYGYAGGFVLPRPMMNILNGGRHADNLLNTQEFMIVPKANTLAKMIRIGSEVYHALQKLLKAKKLSTGLGDEGGFAPQLKHSQQALDYLTQAIKKAGYQPGKQVDLAVDVAASEFYKQGKYYFEGRKLSVSQMIEMYKFWLNKYPLLSLEDGLGEDDWSGWQSMTDVLKDRVLLVGDDIFVTNQQRFKQGIAKAVANSILIKLNQIGTLTETLAVIHLARRNKYRIVISNRSGETCDPFIADLSLATQAEFIKAGAPARGERLAKYNRLLEIEKYYL